MTSHVNHNGINIPETNIPIQNEVVEVENEALLIDDPHLELFQKKAEYYHFVNKLNGNTSVLASIPFINIIGNQIVEILDEIQSIDILFSTHVMKTPATNIELIDRFYILFNDFQQGKKEGLIKFVNDCRSVINNINKIDHPDLIDPAYNFSMYVDLINSERMDLLIRTPDSFSHNPKKLNQLERYRVAVYCYSNLGLLISRYNFLTEKRWGAYLAELKKILLPDRIKESKLEKILELSTIALLKNDSLSFCNKSSLIMLIDDVYSRFHDDDQMLCSELYRVFLGDLRSNYLKVILCDKAAEISQIKCLAGNDFDEYDEQFVNNNRDVYEMFVPRLEEITEWFKVTHKKLSDSAVLLREAPIYFEFGDLSVLESKLSQKKLLSKKDLEEILLQEIRSFSASRNSDFSKVKKIIKYFGENDFNWVHNYYATCEKFHKTSEIVVSTAFDCHLELAKKWQRDLYNVTPLIQKNTCKKSQNRPKNEATQKTATSSQPKEMTNSERPKNEKPAEISIFERLQKARECSFNSFGSLISGCNTNFGADKALSNAQSQLDNLFCTMLRFAELSDRPIAHRQVHAFVIDSVRHATLMSEQMLLALRILSSDSKPELSHNLYDILLHCQFKAGELPIDLRKWVQNASHGELLVRNLDECALGTSPLQNLLMKTRLLLEGNTAFSAQEILLNTIEYCKKAGELVCALQMQINAFKLKPIDQKSLANNSSNAFSLLCKDLSNKVENVIKIDDQPFEVQNEDLKGIRNGIQCIFEKYDNGITNNIFNHLLPHLETEMSFHSTLSPLSAHLHCAHVLMLNQMVAEEVLLNLLGCKMVYCENPDHDLLAMVKTLRMKEEDFTPEELHFLKNGKAVRDLTRYPFNGNGYAKQAADLNKTLHDTLDLSKKQKYTQYSGISDGYKPANKNIARTLDNAKKVVQTDLALLNSILTKVFKKTAY